MLEEFELVVDLGDRAGISWGVEAFDELAINISAALELYVMVDDYLFDFLYAGRSWDRRTVTGHSWMAFLQDRTLVA